MESHRSNGYRCSSLVLLVLLFCVGCAQATDVPASEQDAPQATEEELDQIQDELDEVLQDSKADAIGFHRYRAHYKNMVVAGETEVGPVALIAGTHEDDFPFFGDRPWDNGLLYVDGVGYEFTHREQGEALRLDVDLDADTSEFRIRYQGHMTRVDDGEEVAVDIDIPVHATRHRSFELGRAYAFLGRSVSGEFAGMRWRPYQLRSEGSGVVSIEGRDPLRVEHLNGEIEHGELVNFQLDRLAFSYDYVSVAVPGRDGYAFIDFVAEPLDPGGLIGYFLGAYMRKFASTSMTLQHSDLILGNAAGVDRPPQYDPSVVLFENEVDLELAVLRRQMIQTTDRDGKVAFGLREIFEAK